MSQYYYSPLPRPDIIRLLRVLPHEDKTATIRCQLFNYSLQDSREGTHLYEALSYVWGSSNKHLSISIDGNYLPVTTNLHAALLHLRNRYLERVIWVDAVCINEADMEEKCHQVQILAKIYSEANCVIIWLGEAADDSDRAIEEIRIASGNNPTPYSYNEMTQQAILALLQRSWFRRIWVLQEVAAARHILIMCGSTKIDGYVFCLGLNLLGLPGETYPDLQSLVCPVTNLIRGATFRPKYATSLSGRVSLNIRPLGELTDMFHTREATIRHDMVYALLSMSSDDPSVAGLSPDYTVSWNELFQRLVKFLLCKQVSVKTWDDRQMAVIKSKGCILGQVSLVERDITWYDRQIVNIIFKNTSGDLGDKRERSARWTFQTSAKLIQQGDLVCLLQGAPKPTIVRLCKDYFAVIMIAASLGDKLNESGDVEWSKLLRLITVFPRDFLLVWDWEKSSGKLQDLGEYEALIRINNQVPEHSKTELEGYLDKVTRIWNVALILEDLEEYEEAEERLREAIGGCERAFGNEHAHTLTSRDMLAWIYKKQQRWKEAEKLFMQVIESRKRVQGADQGKLSEAEQVYERALRGYEDAPGPKHDDSEFLSARSSDGFSWAKLSSTDPTSLSSTGPPNPKHDGSAEHSFPTTFFNYTKLVQDEASNHHSDIRSLVSLEDDINSAAESGSDSPAFREAALDYLVKKFTDDVEVLDLYQEATRRLDKARFVRNHRRLLKEYVLDLKAEEQTPSQELAIRFLRSRNERTRISSKIHSIMMPSDTIVKKKMDVLLDQKRDELFLLNRHLEQQDSVVDIAPGKTQVLEPNRNYSEQTINADDTETIDAISDASQDSDNGADEFDNDTLPKLNSVADFLTVGRPFSLYKEKLRSFLSPSSLSGNHDQNALQEAIKTLDVQMIHDLLSQAFIDVARNNFEWLHELVEMGYDYQEIAELLVKEEKDSPWTLVRPPEKLDSSIFGDLHQPGCVHQGGHELSFSPKLITTDQGLVSTIGSGPFDFPEPEVITKEVATSCGLAGIIPISSNRQEWIGRVIFDTDDSTIVSVTYELDLSHAVDVPGCLLRVETALERLMNLISWLQHNHLCCNSFTVLKFSAGAGVVEVVRVPFSLVKLLVAMVSYLRVGGNSRRMLDSALKIAQEVLDLIYGNDRAIPNPSISHPMDLKSAERVTVHACALATQSLCLGLLSYGNAHTGPLQPFFLSQVLKKVILLGIESVLSNEPCLSVELVKLTCFGRMVGGAVVVFACVVKPTKSREYDLLASPEDLVDTWGPGRFIIERSSTDNRRLYAIEIGGGIVRPAADNAAILHWERGMSNYEAFTTSFDPCAKIRIAAITQNNLCPLDQLRSEPVCTSLLENLGTSPGYWQPREIQVGAQAGQYVLAQFNVNWVRQDGITLKDRQLSAARDTIYLPFLESFWGLQISLCTGVARRVPVREMLADVMVAYVKKRLPVPAQWNELLHEHKVLDNFRGPGLEGWFQMLSFELQSLVVQIVRYILEALRDTGYDGRRDEFVIAWPLEKDPFRCFRIQSKVGNHLWTRALADSEDCATFAYVTPNCLETNDQKCRKSNVVEWLNKAVSLETAVCQHKSNKYPLTQALSWTLRPGFRYWIGKPGADLTAKLLEPTTQVGARRLSVTRSRIPENIRKRIESKVQRIREKQNADARATRVLILTAK